ncbi:EF hand domain protein [Rhodovulum sp. P5]|uniref:EF-hand domain-containing protein n=1 Tax=Rhodovulum sp. P5 TaxID=1564506 RepID=UPI0009C1C606|nr:hypothetical protein [Rhodovulum sp. P5]ARE39760.1 EF hand domain protein [Rhodovulum sp. P5]
MTRHFILAAALALTGTAACADGPSRLPDRADRGFVHHWDFNGDGTVRLHEIRRWAPVMFERFDSNKDGMLSGRETALFDAARRSDIRRVGGRYGSEVARMAGGFAIARSDINGDGRITLDEFRLAATDWLALLDRNGDGQLTDYDVTR